MVLDSAYSIEPQVAIQYFELMRWPVLFVKRGQPAASPSISFCLAIHDGCQAVSEPPLLDVGIAVDTQIVAAGVLVALEDKAVIDLVNHNQIPVAQAAA